MLKKIFIIILVVLLLGAGIMAYFLLFSSKKTPTDTGGGFSLQDLFPFNDSGNNTQNGTTDNENDDEVLPDEIPEPSKPPKLVMVAKGPISGAVAFDVTRPKAGQDPNKKDKDGKPVPIEMEPATMLRYSESSTGHTNETYLDKIDISKITNTTIPKIVESFFTGKSGTTAVLRYADTSNAIQTFAGNIPLIAKKDGSPDTSLRGTYLPEDITAIALSPDREKIFSVAKGENGSAGTISLPDGTKKNQLFSLAFSDWTTEWPTAKFVTLTTKPSAKVPGYYYSIDTSSKVMKKIFGGILGLTTLMSPDGKQVLLSRAGNGSTTTSLYNLGSKGVFQLPGATTLPEKCLWQSNTILYCAVPSYMPNAEYPDAWYQGIVSFTDQIYKIDTATFSSVVIANPSDVSASIDATNLTVDPLNTFLVFLNKKDGSLWSLDLRPETTSNQ